MPQHEERYSILSGMNKDALLETIGLMQDTKLLSGYQLLVEELQIERDVTLERLAITRGNADEVAYLQGYAAATMAIANLPNSLIREARELVERMDENDETRASEKNRHNDPTINWG